MLLSINEKTEFKEVINRHMSEIIKNSEYIFFINPGHKVDITVKEIINLIDKEPVA